MAKTVWVTVQVLPESRRLLRQLAKLRCQSMGYTLVVVLREALRRAQTGDRES